MPAAPHAEDLERIYAQVLRQGANDPQIQLAREVEAREQQVEQMAGLAWIAMLGLIFVGTAAFGWTTRQKPA
jgi:hypothetical protein